MATTPRFTFDPLKRYSGVLMQQGRVQLDSDWNEEIDILRRRLHTTTLDIMGPRRALRGCAQRLLDRLDCRPAGRPLDGPGSPLCRRHPDRGLRCGWRHLQSPALRSTAACGISRRLRLPPPATPSSTSMSGNVKSTYVEDPALLDVALGGADTTARADSVAAARRSHAGCRLRRSGRARQIGRTPDEPRDRAACAR